jgi:hypothetical protein
MRRSSYSGLRTIRGFLHANPVSFLYELTSICLPTDLSTTFAFSRIFIRVDDRSPAMCVSYERQYLPHKAVRFAYFLLGPWPQRTGVVRSHPHRFSQLELGHPTYRSLRGPRSKQGHGLAISTAQNDLDTPPRSPPIFMEIVARYAKRNRVESPVFEGVGFRIARAAGAKRHNCKTLDSRRQPYTIS